MRRWRIGWRGCLQPTFNQTRTLMPATVSCFATCPLGPCSAAGTCEICHRPRLCLSTNLSSLFAMTESTPAVAPRALTYGQTSSTSQQQPANRGRGVALLASTAAASARSSQQGWTLLPLMLHQQVPRLWGLGKTLKEHAGMPTAAALPPPPALQGHPQAEGTLSRSLDTFTACMSTPPNLAGWDCPNHFLGMAVCCSVIRAGSTGCVPLQVRVWEGWKRGREGGCQLFLCLDTSHAAATTFVRCPRRLHLCADALAWAAALLALAAGCHPVGGSSC